jgi:hypothetical protein
MPEHDMVVAITSGVRNMQAVLDLVWDRLLPGIRAEALAADADAHGRLQAKLAGLGLPTVAGKPTTPAARQVSAAMYALPKNDDGLEAVGLDTRGETVLVMRRDGREQRLPVGIGSWRRGGTIPVGGVEQPAAATGAWTSDDTFTAKVCLYETPYCATYGLWFSGRALVFDQEMNVAFGATKRPQLVGRR